MIQLIVFIFINSALLSISATTSADLLPISNDTSNNTILKEELIKNYLQLHLPNSKDFHKTISKLSNNDIKNIRDQLNEKKYKFTRPIVGELITTMKINNENNYKELEQILMIFWTTFKSMNNLIEEMKSSTSSIQHLLQKFDKINFNAY